MDRRRRLLPRQIASISMLTSGGMMVGTLVANRSVGRGKSSPGHRNRRVATGLPRIRVATGNDMGSDWNGRSFGRRIHCVERQPLAPLECHPTGAGDVLAAGIVRSACSPGYRPLARTMRCDSGQLRHTGSCPKTVSSARCLMVQAQGNGLQKMPARVTIRLGTRYTRPHP